jgi:hypothetical protein
MSSQPINQKYLRTPGIVPERDDSYDRFIIMDEKPRDMRDMFPIRDRVDAFLGGLAGGPSFDITPGGDLARVPLVGDPRSIRYSPPNAILKTPHLDSPYMDQLIERRFQPLTPPGPGQEVAMTEKEEDKMLLRSLQRGEMGSGKNIDKAIQDLINKINGVGVRGV